MTDRQRRLMYRQQQAKVHLQWHGKDQARCGKWLYPKSAWSLAPRIGKVTCDTCWKLNAKDKLL